MGLPILSLTIMSFNYLRLFVQFHDMAHYSYFKDLKTNRLVGRVAGVITHYPFDAWRDGHNHHHKHFGNLDRFDASQTILFTKAKYESMPKALKLVVRILR
jgi:omega-6 fatty acid desaturase (delta-12 desaturase)